MTRTAQPPAPLPADVTTVPTRAGPMIVGPMTVATWPIAGPMNVSPVAVHTWAEVPAVAPCPGVALAEPQGPAPEATPPRGSPASTAGKLIGPPTGSAVAGGTVLASAAGTAAASGAAATSVVASARGTMVMGRGPLIEIDPRDAGSGPSNRYLAHRASPTGRPNGLLCHAASGIRTHTSRRTMDFESIVSTVPPPPRRRIV